MPLNLVEPNTRHHLFHIIRIAEVAMMRAAPLAICLLWLAYESHFSPSFFFSTVEHGFASLVGGLDDVMVADHGGQAKDGSDELKTASAN